MKLSVIASLAIACSAEQGSPIAKIVDMISELQAKLIAEGEASQKTYSEFANWCGDTSNNLQVEVKIGKREIVGLKATISSEDANIQAQQSAMEDISGSIASSQQELKKASSVRDKEASDFAALEKDLSETIDMLERAIGVIEKQADGGAAMVQLKAAGNVVQVLSTMVQAQSLPAADGQKLTALIQSLNDEDDNQPAYENQSGGVLDLLNDVLEKAQEQLETARSKEQGDLHNFQMLQQSLQDQIKFAEKEMGAARKSGSESEENKAQAAGDLEATSKDLADDESELSQLHHECMTKANEFEAETASRSDEIKALATAKKIIIEATSLSQVSFLQKVSRKSKAGSEGLFKIPRALRAIAKKMHDPTLAQLSSRVEAQIRYGGTSGEAVLKKIAAMLNDMVAKLEQEAADDESEKAFCDKAMAETEAKQADKEAEVEKLGAKIDKMSAHSKQLKSEVARLQKELAELVTSQAQIDGIRQQEKSEFEANKSEAERALAGLKKALKVLNEYYAKQDQANHAHGDLDGGASGIIGMLEMCESDVSKSIAEMVQDETTAVRDHEAQTQANEISKTTKEQDAKYKAKEAAGLEKGVSEYDSDRSAVTTELNAVNQYMKELHTRCVGRADSFEERKAKRETKIQGMKDSLAILESTEPSEGETSAFVQVKSARGLRLRGPIKLR